MNHLQYFISILACVNYAARALTNNNNRLSFHILGGTEAELGEFPHMVRLKSNN